MDGEDDPGLSGFGKLRQIHWIDKLKILARKSPQHRHHSVVPADYWQWDAAGGRRRRSVARSSPCLLSLDHHLYLRIFFFLSFLSFCLGICLSGPLLFLVLPLSNPFRSVSLTAMAIPFPSPF